ncbi:MAG: Gfo/Idh/MocA family oxidoreductase [Candidatus Omnitrophica bacterium]|nr:Gfo/Idh/MocA family oxidoreductase [Candidatus Omnitrophota bacterium]
MINVGIIGCGHWGPNHIRIFSQLPNTCSLMCADLEPKRLGFVKSLFPDIQTTQDYKEMLTNADIDAVCIASPTKTHYEIALQALAQGKHVLCEKPLTLKPEESLKLKDFAEEKGLVLMVGHIFLFNSGIRWLKEYIKSGALGQVYYAYATRTNLGPFRYDVNALWDLAPHDISIFNYLFDSCPTTVAATGHKFIGDTHDDVTFATLSYPNNIAANVHVSWLDPKKVRQMTIVGDQQMVVWDDLDNLGPIKVYDKHVEKTSTYYETYGEFQLLSREGSITIPKIASSEPLKAQGQYFINCVEENQYPALTDAQKGMEVVRVLCAIDESVKNKGACINI